MKVRLPRGWTSWDVTVLIILAVLYLVASYLITVGV